MFQKIKYDSVWLCSGPQDRLKDVQVNGTQVAQVAQFLRSASSRVYGRGNRLVEVAFTVTRSHVSLVNAEQFLFAHPMTLASEGTVVFYLDDVTTVSMVDAVVKGVSQDCAGIWTSHRYSIVGSEIGFTPGLPTEDVMYTGSVSISQGSCSVVIGGLALPSVPRRVWGGVRKPGASGATLWASVRGDSITQDGFIFDLSGAPTDPNHKLDFFYIL